MSDIQCPKCSSTQITANKKGFSAGKAIGGALVTGGIGLLAGFHGSRNVYLTCLKCGHNFKPREAPKRHIPVKQSIEPLNSLSFENFVLKAELPVVVGFLMSSIKFNGLPELDNPELKKLALKYKDKAKFYFLMSDKSSMQLYTEYEVSKPNTVLLFKEGEVLASFEGETEGIEEVIENAL